MNFFGNTSLRHKLTLIAMLSSCVALVVACAAFIIYEKVTFTRLMVEHALITARMIGANSSAELEFAEPASAEKTLKFLNADATIQAACIYDRNGNVFARYPSQDSPTHFTPPPVQPNGHQFGKNSVEVFQRIQLNGEEIGTVYIRQSLEELYHRLRSYLGIAAAVMAMTWHSGLASLAAMAAGTE